MAKAREIPELDCDGAATTGMRQVLLTRLDEVCSFREQALDFTEIKGVHDMRVASRRLRSVSRDFRPFLRKGQLDVAIEDLRALADALGEVRDLDVAISALEKLANEAPAELRDDVLTISQTRAQRREGAREALKEVLTEREVEDLRQDFIRAVENAVRPRRRRRRPEADAPPDGFRQTARLVITRLWEDLVRRSGSLQRPHKSRPLHRMRIAAKRLRYAVELFAQCWGEQLNGFAEEIAEIQSDLGNLHDCDVWIESLGEYLKDFERNTTDNEQGAHVAAVVWLLQYFTEKRTRNYNDALARWYEWKQSDFGPRLLATLY